MSITKPFSTMIDVLRFRAADQPESLAYVFLSNDGAEQGISFSELDRRARSIAAKLQHRHDIGNRALLLYPPGIEYIQTFFGCLYAGVLPIPAYPPRANRHLARLQSIVEDAQAELVLIAGNIYSSVQTRFGDSPLFSSLNWTVLDEEDKSADWKDRNFTSGDLAYLQYTSGSTSHPKGVVLTHGNVIDNVSLICKYLGHDQGKETRGVFWLPPYHDMGLVGGILEPLYAGYPSYLISPVDFVQEPFRWLQAVTRYKATHTGGPNFAFELCVNKISPEQREQLDVTSLLTLFSGAEPIRLETLERFAKYFEPCGFRKEILYPCYGLAEATLLVTGGAITEPPISKTFDGERLTGNVAVEVEAAKEGDRTLVSSGRQLVDQVLAIVDPSTLNRCEEGRVGEIWVSSPSVAQGYWNREEQTRDVFRAHILSTGEGPFLRTGDLGFLYEEELYVTGRLKDLIIIRGRNYYPQDIEYTAQESHPAVQNSNGAAFSVEVDGMERLVVVQEIERQYRKADLSEVIAAIRQAVSEEYELQVFAVVLLKPASIPKTTSGKIQRHACRNEFVNGTLEVLAQDVFQMADGENAEDALEPDGERVELEDLLTAILSTADPLERRWIVTECIRGSVAEVMGVSRSRIGTTQSLSSMGLDSLMANELTARFAQKLGVQIPLVDVLAAPSVELFAEIVLKELAPTGTGELDETERLLAELKDLSEEEVFALLAEAAPGKESGK